MLPVHLFIIMSSVFLPVYVGICLFFVSTVSPI